MTRLDGFIGRYGRDAEISRGGVTATVRALIAPCGLPCEEAGRDGRRDAGSYAYLSRRDGDLSQAELVTSGGVSYVPVSCRTETLPGGGSFVSALLKRVDG